MSMEKETCVVLYPAIDEFEEKVSKAVVKSLRYLPRIGSVVGG